MEDLSEKLDEIITWLKLIGRNEVKKIIREIITNEEDYLLYQNSNGEKTVRELSLITGLSIRTISFRWEIWEKLGIMKKIEVGTGGRGKKLIDLEELGIEIPEIKK